MTYAARERWRKIRMRVETPFALLGLKVIPCLPRRAILALAKMAGVLAYYGSTRHRAIGYANLNLAFGDTKSATEKKWILKRSLENFALVLLDLFWFCRDPHTRLERWTRVTPDFEKHVLCKSAFVALTGHLGNWETAGRYTATRGFPLASVAKPLKNPAIDKMLIEARRVTGQVVVPRGGALRSLIRVLREDRPVAMLLDQNTAPEEGGHFVQFFGKWVPVSPAAASLALKTNTPCLFGFGIPEKGGTYRMEFVSCMDVSEYARIPKEKAVRRLTQQITNVYEQEIRKYPELWLWSYKRWKYVPRNVPREDYPFYAQTCDVDAILEP